VTLKEKNSYDGGEKGEGDDGGGTGVKKNPLEEKKSFREVRMREFTEQRRFSGKGRGKSRNAYKPWFIAEKYWPRSPARGKKFFFSGKKRELEMTSASEKRKRKVGSSGAREKITPTEGKMSPTRRRGPF